MTTSPLLLATLLFSSFAFADESMKKLIDLSSKDMAQRAEEWLCQPTTMKTCSQKDCKDAQPSIWTKINFKEKKYSRCDSKGCDSYEMVYSKSGIYTTIEIPGSGAFLKSLNNGEDYIEVATIGVAAIQYFGACKPIS